MQASERQVKILDYLNVHGDVSLDHLCADLDVSKATVRSELKGLESVLEGSGIALTMLPGNIVRCEGSHNLPGLLVELGAHRDPSSDDLIKLYLLVSVDYVSMQQIADDLHMSRSFVEKRIAEYRREGCFRIASDRRAGVAYCGSPYERLAQFSDIAYEHFPCVDFMAELARLESAGVPVLDGLTRRRIESSIAFADELRQSDNESLTDDAYRQLLIRSTFLSSDDAPGSGDPAPFVTDVDILSPREFELSGPLVSLASLPGAIAYRRRVDNAAAHARASFTESQIRLLTGLMASARKLHKLDIDAVAQSMDEFVCSILSEINETLGVDLRSDQQLRRGLALHIYTTVIRRDSLPAGLDALESREVRYRYPLGYEMATHATAAIERKYGYRPSEPEMVYIAMHFQVAIERLTSEERRVNTAVVCHYGQAAANLIAEKVGRLFPSLDVTSVLSMHEYLACEKRFELVLATERIPETTAQVIYVSPALRSNELDRIRVFVDDQESDYMLIKRLREAEVIDFDGPLTRDEALDLLGSRLEAVGAIKDGFLDSVRRREEMSPTGLAFIAVPHGDPELVRESYLIVGRSREGIDWDGTTIYCVFMFACPPCALGENGAVFSKFYRGLAMLDRRSEVNELLGITVELVRQRLIRMIGTRTERRWS